MDRHLLFFYGTLMSGHGRGNVLTDCDTNVGCINLAEPVARGTIRGTLLAVSAFPGLVEGDGVVHGEVWEAESAQHLAAALRITDAIEGYGGPGHRNMYERIEVPLLAVTPLCSADQESWPGGDELDEYAPQPGDTVLTYRWNYERTGPVIASGDWREYKASGTGDYYSWSAA